MAKPVEHERTLIEHSQSRPCGRWVSVAQTDSLAGTAGSVDDYFAPVPIPPGHDPAAVFAHQEDRLWRYDIFPPDVMRARVCSDDGRVHEGTTIVQRVAFGPFTLESAVRVVQTWSDGAETGFSYATLEGHPERGVSTFVLRRDTQDRLTFAIHARSRPGSVLTLVGRPIARWFQRRITRLALEHFTTITANSLSRPSELS